MISKEELDRAFDSRFDPDIKAKLQCARVAVAGLGGLGSNIAVMLARSGVGHLFLVDFDRVDTTNLNRQAYSIPHLGMNKTDAVKMILADINPFLDIKTQCVKVTPENVARIDFVLHVVEATVISVGDDGLALGFELGEVVDH